MPIEVFAVMANITIITALLWVYIIDKYHNDNNGE
jgi:hypothetical protein